MVKEVNRMISEASEEIAMLILFMSGRLVKNCHATSYNVIVHSESGEGKDAIVREVGKLMPPDLFVARSSITPTTLKNWQLGRKGWSWHYKSLYLEDVSINHRSN